MASITVSGLSDEFVERLKKRAAANSRSVEDEVLYILKRVIGPDADEREARVKEFFEKVEPLLEKQRQWEDVHNVEQIPSEILVRKMRGHED